MYCCCKFLNVYIIYSITITFQFAPLTGTPTPHRHTTPHTRARCVVLCLAVSLCPPSHSHHPEAHTTCIPTHPVPPTTHSPSPPHPATHTPTLCCPLRVWCGARVWGGLWWEGVGAGSAGWVWLRGAQGVGDVWGRGVWVCVGCASGIVRVWEGAGRGTQPDTHPCTHSVLFFAWLCLSYSAGSEKQNKNKKQAPTMQPRRVDILWLCINL